MGHALSPPFGVRQTGQAPGCPQVSVNFTVSNCDCFCSQSL